MTIQYFIQVVKQRWKTILAITLIGIAGAASIFALVPPKYTAQTTLYVSAQAGDSPQQAYQAAQLSEQRVKSYTRLITGSRIITETATRLRYTGNLQNAVTATSALDSVLIDIAATDESAQEAARIANTIANVASSVIADLERPADGVSSPAVSVRIVEPAVAPQNPSSITLLPTLILGLVLGGITGSALAVGAAVADTKLRLAQVAEEISGRPNLGTVLQDPTASGTPLTVVEQPRSVQAEAYRQLRTNLQFVDVDNPCKVIVVTSSVPSEGKTTTSANLGLVLASTGQRVLLIEADLRKPALSGMLGLDNSVGLTRALTGQISAARAVQTWGMGDIDVISSGVIPPNPSELLSSKQMRDLIVDLRSSYDYIIVDTPPLLPVTDAAAVAPFVDGVLLIARHGTTKRHQLAAAVESLRSVGATLLGTVLTVVPMRESGYGSYAEYKQDGSRLAASATSSGPGQGGVDRRGVRNEDTRPQRAADPRPNTDPNWTRAPWMESPGPSRSDEYRDRT